MKISNRLLHRVSILFFVFLSVCCFPSAAPSQDCLDYGEYIHWLATVDTPYAWRITVGDGFGYVAGLYQGVQIVELTDPNQPILTGEFDTPGYARAIAVDGGYAFVADDHGGLHVADVSVPSTPTIVASLSTPDDAVGVDIRGEVLFVAASDAGIVMVDVSEPVSPQIVGNFAMPTAATDVECYGDQALFVHENGFQIVSLADPLAPAVIGSIALSGRPMDVEIRGEIAYVAASTSGLHIVSIAVPEAPVLLGSESPAYDFSAVGVWVSNQYAYVGTQFTNPEDAPILGRLDVLDVSNPADPQRVARLNSPLPICGVAGGNGFVAYANNQEGVHLISDNSPLAAPEIGSYGGFNASSVAMVSPLSGQYALVTHHSSSGSELIVFDVSDPAAPTSVASVYTGTPYGGDDVTVEGDLAYLVVGYAGLWVVDVANPTSPAILGSLDLDADAIEVVVSGHHAYVALFYNEIAVVDVSDPATPLAVASISIPAQARSFDISGPYLYVGSADYGLHIFDISDPTTPVSVGTVATPSYAGGVMVVDGIAYVADSDAGLLIVDVTDPTTPVIIGERSVHGHARDVTVAQDVAYVSAGNAGLQIVDVGDPASPMYVGSVLSMASSSVVANDIVYVAASFGGLHTAYPQCPISTAVFSDPVTAVGGFLTLQAHPNPFNPTTLIEYTIREAARVSVDVYDLRGRLVRGLVNDRLLAAGTHDVVWDGRSDRGLAMSSGVYLCHIEAGTLRASQRLVLVR
jgi:hypothetical protein